MLAHKLNIRFVSLKDVHNTPTLKPLFLDVGPWLWSLQIPRIVPGTCQSPKGWLLRSKTTSWWSRWLQTKRRCEALMASFPKLRENARAQPKRTSTRGAYSTNPSSASLNSAGKTNRNLWFKVKMLMKYVNIYKIKLLRTETNFALTESTLKL